MFSEKRIIQSIQDSANMLLKISNIESHSILRFAEIIINTFNSNNKLYIIGNGGSAADAQHMAAELIGRFSSKLRKALPAIALSTDTSVITAIGNDLHFANIFARQIMALGESGDVLFVLSTSGHSRNIIEGIYTAKAKNMNIIGLLGNDGGNAKDIMDSSIIIPSNNTAIIQESHISIIHAICKEVDLYYCN